MSRRLIRLFETPLDGGYDFEALQELAYKPDTGYLTLTDLCEEYAQAKGHEHRAYEEEEEQEAEPDNRFYVRPSTRHEGVFRLHIPKFAGINDVDATSGGYVKAWHFVKGKNIGARDAAKSGTFTLMRSNLIEAVHLLENAGFVLVEV